MISEFATDPRGGWSIAQTGLLALLARLGRALMPSFDAVLSGLVTAGVCVDTICELLELTREHLYDQIVCLGLRSPPDRPPRRRTTSGWTKEDEQNALVWRAAGVHPAAIGEHLNRKRSANAVRAKLRRMGQSAPPRKVLFRPEASFFDACATDALSSARRPGGHTACNDDNSFETDGPAAPATSFAELFTDRVFPLSLNPQIPSEAGLPEGADAATAAAPLPSSTSNAPTPTSPDVIISAPEAAAAEPVVELADAITSSSGAAKEIAVRKTRTPARRAKGRIDSEGQRDFGFMAIVGGNTHPASGASPAPPAPTPVPATCEQVDFNDLSWAGQVRYPLTHKPTVYVYGMLMMGGLHWADAAMLTAKSAAAFRTLRTRMGIGAEPDRRKIGHTFDVGKAIETAEQGGWIVKKGLRVAEQRGGDEYFWAKRSDRGAHLAPIRRQSDPLGRRQPTKMTLVPAGSAATAALASPDGFSTFLVRIGVASAHAPPPVLRQVAAQPPEPVLQPAAARLSQAPWRALTADRFAARVRKVARQNVATITPVRAFHAQPEGSGFRPAV